MEEIIWNLLSFIIFPGLLFVCIYSLFLEWLDRKVYARVQNRVGPLITGSKGILQPFADFIKLLSKEDIKPECADRWGFLFSPLTALTVAMMTVFFVPIVGYQGLISLPVDLLIVVFISTLFNILVILAGYFSVSRFSTIGAVRAGLQFVAYEIPFVLSIICAGVLAKSLSIAEIVYAQNNIYHMPFVVYLFPAFIIYLVSSLAKLERVPFDIPEAETELAAGWQVEYSGRKLALFKLAADIKALFVSGLGAALFLGGPIGPAIAGLEPLCYLFWFIVKTLFIVALIGFFRGLFARFRIDQAVNLFWKTVLPASLIVFIYTSVLIYFIL